jgi:hypothetical protein
MEVMVSQTAHVCRCDDRLTRFNLLLVIGEKNRLFGVPRAGSESSLHYDCRTGALV